MADVRIDQAPGGNLATLQDADVFALARGGVGYNATLSVILSHTHTHTIANVTGLQTALDGKAATGHGHAVSEISDATSAGQAMVTAADAAAQQTLLNVENGATADQTDGEIETAYNAQVSVVSQVDAEAGTSTTAYRWTPQRVGQAIAALGGSGGSVSVEDEGSEIVAEATTINFVGGGVTATDAGGGQVNVTVAAGSAPVDSVFGRTGVVVPVSGDYDISEIANAGALASLNTVGTTEISDGAVTLAKMSDMATASLLGRDTAGTGDPEVLSAADVRALLNVENGATADQTGAEIKSAYEGEANTNAYTDAEQTKLAGIETAADVTDATNVNAAGATMNTDSDVSSNSWVLDQDDLSSDDATKLPTQQSVKAYVDTGLATKQAAFAGTVVLGSSTTLTAGGVHVITGNFSQTFPVISGDTKILVTNNHTSAVSIARGSTDTITLRDGTSGQTSVSIPAGESMGFTVNNTTHAGVWWAH